MKNWFWFVLQIATPSFLLMWLFYREHVDQLPGLSQGDALTISLAAMQVTLAALAIFIGIAAIVGYQTLQQTAKARADDVANDVARTVAEEVATKQVKSYFDAHFSDELLDDRQANLSENTKERPEKGIKERRNSDAEGGAV